MIPALTPGMTFYQPYIPVTLTITPNTFGPITVGTPYSQVYTASGGLGGALYTWVILVGSLPDGLSLSFDGDNTATISGTPTTAESYSFILAVVDSAEDSGDISFSGTTTVTPGSLTFTTTGAGSFTTPAYNTLVIEAWGAGASGGALATNGNDGSASTVDVLTANGGQHGTQGNSGGTKGNGGTASGGDVNTSGGNGTGGAINSAGNGGNCPNGGSGGTSSSKNGGSPGAGGAGSGSETFATWGGGGGGGGYCKKSHVAGEFPVGSGISFIVGTGGASVGSVASGSGANGQIKFTWS